MVIITKTASSCFVQRASELKWSLSKLFVQVKNSPQKQALEKLKLPILEPQIKQTFQN